MPVYPPSHIALIPHWIKERVRLKCSQQSPNFIPAREKAENGAFRVTAANVLQQGNPQFGLALLLRRVFCSHALSGTTRLDTDSVPVVFQKVGIDRVDAARYIHHRRLAGSVEERRRGM